MYGVLKWKLGTGTFLWDSHGHRHGCLPVKSFMGKEITVHAEHMSAGGAPVHCLVHRHLEWLSASVTAALLGK